MHEFGTTQTNDRFTKRKICPFCRKHFEENHREPILREGKNWLVTKTTTLMMEQKSICFWFIKTYRFFR